MTYANKFLKDITNRNILPKTTPENILFEDKTNLKQKLLILDAELKKSLDKKATVIELENIQIALTNAINLKLDSSTYLVDLEAILKRLSVLEGSSDSGGGDVIIPPNLMSIINEIKADVEALKPKIMYVSSVPSTISVGGIDAGFVTDGIELRKLIDDMLHPYIEPVCSIATGLKSSYVEEGSTVPIALFNVNVKPLAKPIKSIELYVDGLLTQSINYTSTSLAPISEQFTLKNLTKTTRVFAKIYDGSSVSQTNNLDIVFIKPMYFGATSDSVDLNSLTKVISNNLNHGYVYTVNNQHMSLIAYGFDMYSAIDQNGFDITSSFVKENIDIKGITYNIFKSNKVIVDDFRVTFKLSKLREV